MPFNANVINVWEQNASGHHLSFDQIEQQAIAANGGTPPPLHEFQAWMTQHHPRDWVSYQPNSWFWHFQTIEATAYVLVAVLLAGATVMVRPPPGRPETPRVQASANQPTPSDPATESRSRSQHRSAPEVRHERKRTDR